VFGKNRDRGIRRTPDGDLEVVHLGDEIGESHLIVHDVHHPQAYYAFQLAHMEHRKGFPTPIGVFRAWENVPRYEDLINDQIADAKARRGSGDLGKLLNAGDTWTVPPR
jgi:2-oxoglutarate ferredoxin oxidoreductase subunit beta